MASLQIEKAPTIEPVTLASVKSWLRIEQDDTDSDDLLIGLIPAARELVEGFTGRSLISKKYRQTLDSFPYFTDTVMSQLAFPPSYYSLPRYSTTLWNYSQMIKLLVSPLVSVDRIEYCSSKDAAWHSLMPGVPLWRPGRTYKTNDQVRDISNNIQAANNDGTSGDNPPTWSTLVGFGQTVDNNITWTLLEPSAADAFFIDIDSEPARIFPGPAGAGPSLGFWPSVMYVPNAVQIHFTAGYGASAADILASGRQGMVTAMLMLIAGWSEHREAISPLSLKDMPHHVQALLWNHKIYDLQPTRG